MIRRCFTDRGNSDVQSLKVHYQRRNAVLFVYGTHNRENTTLLVCRTTSVENHLGSE